MIEPIGEADPRAEGERYVCNGCGETFVVPPALHIDEDLEARGGVPDRCNACVRRRLFLKGALEIVVGALIPLAILAFRLARKWGRKRPQPPDPQR